MSKLVVDISGMTDFSEYPWLEHWPKQVPIKEGEHHYEYDVIEEALGEDVVKKTHDIIEERFPYDYTGKSRDKPLGINKEMLPKGAEIKTID